MSKTTTAQEVLSKLRRQQFYLVEMSMITPSQDPLSALAPLLEEHLAWLIERENNGTLFLAGTLGDETGWDGSGLAIVRAESRAAAEADAQTEPFCRAGIRKNTVRGWQLNEGNVTLRLKLFDDSFEIA
ncbi:YciI family protein [Streptomyces sp. NPDC052415]|uniref:YciI family protein n=1 Tax=Streptomyces sp. NPDC052415 TaxID=3365690 RepID=UPI0037D7FF6C